MSTLASLEPTGFDRFGLHDLLMRGVRAAGFDTPRPIQDETIPAGLAGRDVLGLAQTGTGKTAAFALPLLQRLLDVRGRGPRILVLAPTRELATQIAAEIRLLSKFTRLKMITIYGGVPVRGQINALRQSPEIVVGCPGRVLDLLGRAFYAWRRSKPSFSTRPTTCSTWVFFPTFDGSSRRCRPTARTCSFRPPCRGRCARWRTTC
ncbi:MAG: DEAD/DEAH box helicase [Acidobacteriota bacterium]|nr:DEAD/DEAH box helicase [Acidobacteriota bacterium]